MSLTPAGSILTAPTLCAPEKERVLAEFRAAAGQFTALTRSIDNLAGPGAGTWTGRDICAHLAALMDAYAHFVGGEPSPVRDWSDAAPWNASWLDTVHEQAGGVLADRIDAGVETLVAAARAQPDNVVVPWHGGTVAPVAALLGALTGEFLLHGRDLARAHGRAWKIPSAAAHSFFRGVLPMGPLILDAEASAGVRARIDIRLRGENTRAVFAIDDGTMTVQAPQPHIRADCYISGDPVAIALVLVKRTGPYAQALRGNVMAWGRRPWLALMLPSLFHAP